MPSSLTVSQFISLVNETLEPLRGVSVEGEVSEFRISQNKWVSFWLKDEKASVNCFMVIFRLKTPLEDGMKVRVWGKPRVYPRYGKFSINVAYLELAGEGALRRAFELTKTRLEKEGLFDPERKRPLPLFPQTIGLITSPEAAAYSDFLKVLGHRFGGLKIYFTPVKVQGKQAIEEIVGALDWFNRNYRRLGIELLVLTRGGGSLEELQAFNSEEVARAIFSSKIPVVCGVGHERDESLADFVADLRASTPSNAAEIIIRHRQEVLEEIDHLLFRIEERFTGLIRDKRKPVEDFLATSERFMREKALEAKNIFLVFLKNFRNFQRELSEKNKELRFHTLALKRGFENLLQSFREKVFYQEKLLKSYHPKEVLKRGYSIVKKKDGEIVKDARTLKLKESLELLFARGKAKTEVRRIFNL